MQNNYSPEVEGFPTSWVGQSTLYGGYSLEIPEGWTVHFGNNGTADILPPIHRGVDRIFVQYVPFEKPVEEDLIEWLERWADIEEEENPTNWIGAFDAEVFESSSADDSQQAYEHGKAIPSGQGYVLTNGQLALRLRTNGLSDRQDAILRRMAESVQFASDAPTKLLDLYTSETLPYTPPAIDEYLHLRQVEQQAWAAYHQRGPDGEAPTELLQDAEVADAYIRIVELFAARAARAENAILVQEQTTLPATPTFPPQPSSELISESEGASTDGLTQQPESPLLSAPTIPPRPTSTPLPTATPTTGPEDILANLSMDHPGLEPYVVGPLFRSVHYWAVLWYDPSIWQEEEVKEGSHLVHRRMGSCSMRLAGTGFGERLPFSAQDLAGIEWNVYWLGFNDGLGYVSSGTELSVIVYLNLPEDQEYRESDKQSCQTDVEAVVDTLSLVNTRN